MTEQLTPLWTDATATGITAAQLEAFLRDHGMTTAVRVYEGPDLPNDPGACLVVTWLTGPGFSLEQLLDTPAFQVRTIGPQGNPFDAGVLANEVDKAFTNHSWPAILGGKYVVEIRRAGGRPSNDRVDNAGRTHYVCTYLADVEAD
jgi:hypothetical protein